MDVRGNTDPRFSPVRDCFAEVLTRQKGTGAGFAAWSDGRLVVDLWGGHADSERQKPWQADSLVQPYSVSKPFAAVCALRLVETGRLALDAPVQRYWPEFRAPVTVRHVLSHQAGVVVLDRKVPTEAFYDWDYLCSLLAAQQPSWEPGTDHGESALFYGHLVGELVRRVDGRRIGRFLREEICGPLGLDFAFGLSPAQQAEGEVQPERAADLLAQEPSDAAPVDPADQLADQVAVEQRRFAVVGTGLPRRLLRGQQRAQVVPVVEGLGGHLPVEYHHSGLMRKHVADRGRGAEFGPVPLHGRVQGEPSRLDQAQGADGRERLADRIGLDQAVGLPRLLPFGVGVAAPQVDHQAAIGPG